MPPREDRRTRDELRRIQHRYALLHLFSHAFTSIEPNRGRPGGNRTPNLRFWRPPLCQLSYWPTDFYFRIFATTPAPTVLPPSRMAKRSPCSIAIGAISSTTILMLSPGMTISTPSGSSTAPVTSVVRK